MAGPAQKEQTWWDKINPFHGITDLFAQGGQTSQSAVEALKDVNTGVEAAEEAEEAEKAIDGASKGTGGLDGALGILGGLGVLTGGLTTAKGVQEIRQGKTGEGLYDATSGVLGMGQGATSLLTPFVDASSSLGQALGPAGGFLGAATGGLQIGKGIAEATNGKGGDAAFDLLQGGANATAGIATLAGAAPVAAVAGAGAAGMSVGKLWADWTEKDSKGNFGVDADTGQQRSAYDAAADSGIAAHKWFDNLVGAKEGSDSFGDTVGNVVGAAAAGGMGIVNTFENVGKDAWHAVSSW